MARILGLDLGTNSIGWAVVDKDGDKFQLIDKGVRIFQEGVKIEKGIESSKAAERTGYRSARRIKYRRKIRKIRTLEQLSKFGCCPNLTEEELSLWRYKKVYPENDSFKNWWRTDENKNITPYYFRNLVVTEKLDLDVEENRFKIGRALYHICQRRGFLSNRLEGTKESDGAVKKAIKNITEEKGELTLGQYFYDKYLNREKIRDIYTHREEHYLSEFNKICEVQDLPKEFVGAVKDAIFYQRPLKSQKELIGKCVFEKNKQRCAISHPLFEEYRMLCFINNIKIKTPNDEKLRFLNSGEKQKILPQFFRKSKDHFDFEDLVKQIAPKKQYCFYRARNKKPEYYQFNFSMKTTVSGCPVSARFKSLFGDAFIDSEFNYKLNDDGNLPKSIQEAWHVLLTFDSDVKLNEFAVEKLNFDDEQQKEFSKIKLKLDYSSLSLKAIKKILPYLRVGMIYSHSVFMANLDTVIPKEKWSDPSVQKDISDEIKTLLSTQNEEKQIVEIVNGIIKTCRENGECWSNEAKEYFVKDILKHLKAFYGANKYASFSEDKKGRIEYRLLKLLEVQMRKNNDRGEFAKIETIDEKLKAYIIEKFDVSKKDLENIYHPAAIEVYKKPLRNVDGNLYLGSPMVSTVRNPMAMRALHQLRKVINELIKNEVIDSNTKVNIEMARDLMNANERKAYQRWQSDNEKQRKDYFDRIKEYYVSQKMNTEPSADDILKYKFWEEQNHKCLYTGKEICISDFLGANPKFDIEHTIPRSLSFDNSQVNKTLCDSSFNRSVKRNKIPFELSNHNEILARIEKWKEKYENLEIQIAIAVRQSKNALDKDAKDRAIQKRHKLVFEKRYWREKYGRFEMEDVPSGFKNSQLVDTGIITKYSRMYLNTVFDKVYTVKGNTVADFRKIWGLQDEYEKKARVNHIHHCIDAITIACISKENYERLAKFYHDYEEMNIRGAETKPDFEKPWSTFTEDVKKVEKEVFVSHYTADDLPKKSKKKLRKRGVIQKNSKGEVIYQQGDSVRGSLHKETFYGAIAQNKNGEIIRNASGQVIPNFVVRKAIVDLKKVEVEKIVDKAVKEKVQAAIKAKKIVFANSDTANNKILETIWMNEGKKIPIKKVRIFQSQVKDPLKVKKHRDISLKDKYLYKENYYAVNGGNYLMGIFEGENNKGKIIRDYKIINNIEAANIYKKTSENDLAGLLDGYTDVDILSVFNENMSLLQVIKPGNVVLLYKESPDEIWSMDNIEMQERLYIVRGVDSDGIKLYFHKEARPTTDVIKAMNNQIDERYRDELLLDLKYTKKQLEKKGLVIQSEKEIRINAIQEGAKFEIYNVSNERLCSVDDINPFLKVSKLTTPKGGDVIGKCREFPYVKFKASNFNALIEGVDFRISPLGKITKL